LVPSATAALAATANETSWTMLTILFDNWKTSLTRLPSLGLYVGYLLHWPLRIPFMEPRRQRHFHGKMLASARRLPKDTWCHKVPKTVRIVVEYFEPTVHRCTCETNNLHLGTFLILIALQRCWVLFSIAMGGQQTCSRERGIMSIHSCVVLEFRKL
jgi:hypothetical protein